MFTIGAHLSINKGFENIGLEALSIDANTFQFFPRSPRGGKAKKLDPDDVDKLQELMDNTTMDVILAHAPYIINLASKSEKTRNNAYEIFEDDLRRLDQLPNNMYNFHPGSHVQQGVDKGIELIVDSLNKLIREDQKTTVLLETMAGKGTEIGRSFEELQAIIEKVELDDKLGVCLDTCHVYDAGYDIVNNLDGVLDEFDSVIGLDRLKAIHLNDSKFGLSSHKDRHEKIGLGKIGIDAITDIINHEKLRDLPFYLETPNDVEGYKNEIELLRGLYKE
ncbi:MAG: deoxyribonuclease IV [Methanosphaera sp.]|jgi:deoxyribonuclease-4|uniref:deoxyribonuclease IV n=1 Tax=Methanosphaera TaxID=2316 RepID=UPI002380B55D|nr:deoxyribonuclease IV [Candidatus Methanosphaera massiliense]MDD6285618.1 deoxyribonuclease IV [Methanobacteriaceae archaeon]MDE4079052.1 deoxyribonuclease IV [Candidatus Methanosphaera massiliense]